ncbi:type VII secretion-associated serine protease mycosin [Mycobacterium paraterrae]|uniref:Type VII secretion-associated serine protease mycosin n=1 Tax=Mycobacterium paraterrae TaxID=577492 RepID=A0ABY3VIZ0_9MYCO|nr:type VII secretion-associated serine protease mycosin [Mycobacterium paraterrae]UMB68591.1 type VII secretion-associated serine protease mycosin [Mycobacterium paraterrae]
MQSRSAIGRCVVIAALVVVSGCITPSAHAVSPPPIDPSRLPPPAPARPPLPTVQRETCATLSMTRGVDSTQLSGLDLQQVWKLTTGSGQRVAVIDTGVSSHPRLPHLTAGGDYVSAGNGTQDCDGHGTAVAGIIGAAADPTHADAFSGVAPGVELISVRQSSTKFGAVADATNSGFGDVDTMARAVRTAADLGATVINISSVACARGEAALDDRPLGAALAYAVDIKNVVVVAAAGNTGSGQCPEGQAGSTVIVSPAWYDDFVLTVGSVNARGEPSSFSMAGPWVDVAAPGEGVISLSSSGTGLANAIAAQDRPAPLSGTSYAAPVVSGLAALIRSRFPTWTARQVMQRIKATAHHPPSRWDPQVGAGRVDALAAVSTDTPTTPAAPPTRKSAPVASPVRAAAPDRRAQRAAIAGATICGAASVGVLTFGALRSRLRRAGRSGNERNVMCD